MLLLRAGYLPANPPALGAGHADEKHFNHALFLYNVLFDPREILGLIDTGLREPEVVKRLIGAFYGAVQGWVRTGDNQSGHELRLSSICGRRPRRRNAA